MPHLVAKMTPSAPVFRRAFTEGCKTWAFLSVPAEPLWAALASLVPSWRQTSPSPHPTHMWSCLPGILNKTPPPPCRCTQASHALCLGLQLCAAVLPDLAQQSPMGGQRPHPPWAPREPGCLQCRKQAVPGPACMAAPRANCRHSCRSSWR